MINKVASTIQVDVRLHCLTNCTVSPVCDSYNYRPADKTCLTDCTLSPVCDSYNYRPADKTCQLNTHDTPLIANSSDIVADNDWTWWSPTFCTVV